MHERNIYQVDNVWPHATPTQIAALLLATALVT